MPPNELDPHPYDREEEPAGAIPAPNYGAAAATRGGKRIKEVVHENNTLLDNGEQSVVSPPKFLDEIEQIDLNSKSLTTDTEVPTIIQALKKTFSEPNLEFKESSKGVYALTDKAGRSIMEVNLLPTAATTHQHVTKKLKTDNVPLLQTISCVIHDPNALGAKGVQCYLGSFDNVKDPGKLSVKPHGEKGAMAFIELCGDKINKIELDLSLLKPEEQARVQAKFQDLIDKNQSSKQVDMKKF